MKRFYLILSLCLPITGLAQEKIPFIDGQELIAQAAQAGNEGNYERTLELLNSIDTRDSLYCTSLVSKSYYLLNAQKFREAVQVADAGLVADCGESNLSFYINKAVGYINSDQLEIGLSTIEEALEVYPRNFQLWYNKGLILERTEKTAEAVAAYQNAVFLNPIYALPHVRLGNISFKQELTAQAMMSLNMYLLLNPDGEDSFTVLSSLNDLVRTNNPNTAIPGTEVTGDDSSFEQLNLLLDNRLALNKEYKVDTKLDIALTKQNHLLLSQLSAYNDDGGFWSQVYVPFYKWLWDTGKFQEFTNLVSFSIENEGYREIVRQDVEGLKKFMAAFLMEWGSLLQRSSYKPYPEDKGLVFYYSDLKLNGIGQSKGNVHTGEWQFFDSSGILTGEGNYDNTGKRTGFWKWYNADGGLNETAHYKNGILEGENRAFFANGKPKYVANYKNDQLEGEHLVYSQSGALLEKKYFKNGALEGNYESYFPVGRTLKEFDIIYSNGLIEDKVLEYYADGKIFAEMSFKGGEKNGIEKRYNRGGSLFSEVKFVSNKPVGAYQAYYANGKLSERSGYKNGFYDGLYEAFYEDGTLKVTGNTKKGTYQDVFKYFDKDAKLHYEYEYKDGEVIAYRYFDKAGELLAGGKRKGGEFHYKSFSPYAEVTSEGVYDIKGGKKGLWKFYSDNGVLTGEGEYIEDKAEGLYTQYYETGEKLSEANYKSDTLNGYYKSFFINGQMQSQGWYKEGAEHGEWRQYYPTGKIKAKNFFHKGDFHGTQEFFGVGGKLVSTLLYNFGEVVSEKFYDTKGNVFEEIDRTKEGEYVLEAHHYNSAVSHETTYVNGIKHGPYVQYDDKGNKIEEGSYLNGAQSGTWVSYYPGGGRRTLVNFSRGDLNGELLYYYEDGTLETRRIYEYGVQTGNSEFFHENGELSVLTPYTAGDENGRKEFYDESGRLELVRFYESGRLMGYSYLDQNSKELPMIPLQNETGIIRSYFDNGQVSREMEYLHGNVTGTYKSYYYSGEPKLVAAYESGNYHGLVKDFYPDGKLKSEKTYLYGDLHGVSREFYANGQLKTEVNYLNDKKHGSSVTYSEQGEQVTKEQYFNGSTYEAEEI